MVGRGVLFALSEAQVEKLQAAETDGQVIAVVQQIEELTEVEWQVDVDKAWDAIHRSLTDGRLLYENGDYPLNLCILGGYQLYGGDDYIVSAVDSDDVKALAGELGCIKQEELRERYKKIPVADYPQGLSGQDFEYTWMNFKEEVRYFLFFQGSLEGQVSRVGLDYREFSWKDARVLWKSD